MSDRPDLFEFLGRINQADLPFYHALTDAQKKQFAPLVMMRWLTGTSDGEQIKRLNEHTNELMFNLSKHPDLLFKLMMAAGNKKATRFNFLRKGKPPSKHPTSLDILMRFYQCNSREAQIYLRNISKDDLMKMAAALGDDKETIKKLKKE